MLPAIERNRQFSLVCPRAKTQFPQRSKYGSNNSDESKMVLFAFPHPFWLQAWAHQFEVAFSNLFPQKYVKSKTVAFSNTFFVRTILEENEAHFCLKFKNNLRTIPASAEKQSLKFSIYEHIYSLMCRIEVSVAYISKLHFASCFFTGSCGFQCASTNKTSNLFNEIA